MLGRGCRGTYEINPFCVVPEQSSGLAEALFLLFSWIAISTAAVFHCPRYVVGQVLIAIEADRHCEALEGGWIEALLFHAGSSGEPNLAHNFLKSRLTPERGQPRLSLQMHHRPDAFLISFLSPP